MSYKFRRAFTQNLPLKALSLFIAIVLWTIVSGERDEEWSYPVPLDIVNLPEELIITNNVPGFLDLRLQGSHSFIKGLNPKDMAVQIDISKGTKGSNIYPITPDLISTPRGATVTRINPSYITLELEKVVRKQVSLRAEVQGKPAPDFFIDSIEVIPPSMEISGAKSEIRSIRTLKTGSIDISGANKDISRTVPIDLSGKKVIPAQKEPVTVKVVIKEVSEKLEIKNIAPTIINTDKRYRASASPKAIHILIEGPKSIVKSLKDSGIDISLDAAELKPGNYKKQVEVGLPEAVRLIYAYPKEVNLKISKK